MTMGWAVAFDWSGAVLGLLIKSTAALAAALVVVALLRGRSASLRHSVLAFFLAGLLLIPALAPFEFGWETGLLPATAADVAEAPDSGEAGAAGRLGDEAGGNRGARPAAGMTEARIQNAPHGLNGSAPISGTPPAGTLNGAPVPRASRWGAAKGAIGIAFSLIWAAGLVYLMLRLAAGLHGAHRLTRESEFVRDPAWKVLLDRLLTLLGLRRAVHLKAHGDVLVPLTWGVFRPVILVPAGYERWTDDQRSSALLHELSHIKRADFLFMTLVRLSLAVFWFNPLAWAVFGLMKREQEKACDELVLRTGLKPSTYAANLLFFRRTAGFRWDPSAALLGMFGRASLNGRLAAILKHKLTFKEVGMKTKIMLGSIVILAVTFIGTARPAEERLVKADALIPAPAPASISAASAGPLAIGPSEGFVPPAEAAARAQTPAAMETETADAEPASQEKAAAKEEQEKKQAEKDKKADETKRTIVITSKDGKKTPLEITIVGGGETKTLKVDKTITLKKGAEGELILLGPEGKEIEILKGDPIRLRIKEGRIEVLKEGEPLKLAEGGVLKLVAEKNKGHVAWVVKEGEEGKEGSYHILPKGELKSGGITLAKGLTGYVLKDADSGDIHITIGTGKEKEGHEVLWVGKVDAEPRTFVVSKVDVKPHVTVVGKGDAKAFVTLEPEIAVMPHISWTAKEEETELKKKLEELRETLAKFKAKEIDMAALEKAVAEMEAELKEHEEAFKKIEVHVSEKPVTYSVVRKVGDEEGRVALWIGEGDAPRPVTIATGKKGDFSLAIAADAHELSPEAYERIVQSLRKELPEGYAIESDYDSAAKGKSGMITLKISGPDGKKGVSADLAKKLAAALKEAMKKESDAKK